MDKMREQYGKGYKDGKEELQAKIDKAIEWILHYATMQANPYKREGMRRALQMLKEKIGE